MKKILPLVFFIIILLTGCNIFLEGRLMWKESSEYTKYNSKFENDVVIDGNQSWLSANNVEMHNDLADVTFEFEEDKLYVVSCIFNKATSKEEQGKIYDNQKEYLSFSYGKPEIDTIKKTNTDYSEYKYTEWYDDVTTIRLTYNLENSDDYNIYLTYYCTDYLRSKDSETQTSMSKPSSIYSNSTTWALQSPYAFAVEVTDYNGDILSAGKYTFSVSNTKLGEAPIYDIYVKSKEYTRLADLGTATFSVGGANSSPVTYELVKGNYVYVVPYSELVYEPKGYLEIKQ